MFLHAFENGKVGRRIAITSVGINGKLHSTSPRKEFFIRDYRGTDFLGISLKKVFPCLRKDTSRMPNCVKSSGNEHRNHRNRVFLEMGGKNLFGMSGYNFGIGIQKCRALNRRCWPCYTSVTITCYLPRPVCG